MKVAYIDQSVNPTKFFLTENMELKDCFDAEVMNQSYKDVFFFFCLCLCVCLCVGQLCGEGWQHVGEACLKINSSRESYDNAQHYCKNMGGNIASLLTDNQVNFVLEELQKYQLQDKVGGQPTADLTETP